MAANERNTTTATTTDNPPMDDNDPWSNPFTPSQIYASELSAWSDSYLGTALQQSDDRQSVAAVVPPSLPTTNTNKEHSVMSSSTPTPLNIDPSPPSSSGLPSPKEFLARFQTQAYELIKNVYVEADRSLRISANGTLTTNLAEDLIYLLNMQVAALDEYLAEYYSSTTVANDDDDNDNNDDDEDIYEYIRSEAITSLLFAMYTRQLSHRDVYLIDVEGCCAAANDFARCAELVEDWAIHVDEQQQCVEKKEDGEEKRLMICLMKERELPDLVRLYSMDAEYALRLACRFALDTIIEEVEFADVVEGVCGRRWEEDGIIPSVETPSLDGGTAGEPDSPTSKAGAALTTLLDITEEFLSDAEEYLNDEHLYRKVTEATIRGIVVYYVSQLLGRAERVRQRRTVSNGGTVQNKNSEENILHPDVPFADPNVASKRMAEDIYALKSFFRAWVLEMPAINQHIESMFAPLIAMQQCLELAGDISRIGSEGGTYDFVAELFHALNDDLEMAIKLVQDLWGLAMPLGGGGTTYIEVPASVKKEVCRVANNATSRDEDSTTVICHVTPRFHVPGLSLRHLLVQMYCTSNSSCDDLIVVSSPKHLPRLSRKKAVKALKADFVAARKKLGKVPLSKSLSKKKMKKKATDFLRTCREAGKLSPRN